jgi:ferritin-like metal-binding protein YciE
VTLDLKPPFPPMEALSVAEVPRGDCWQYEPKWDGFRCLVFRDRRKVELQSKSGRMLSSSVSGTTAGEVCSILERGDHCQPLSASRGSSKELPMGLFTKDIETMDDLFVHTLRDIYYAEQQIVKALPEMIEKASDPKLKDGFKTHLAETRNHVKRVEDVFRMHGTEAKGIDCPAIDGIIEEADAVASEADNKGVMDAALIAAAQAVEHYEMTRYGSLIAWARQLGRNDCADVLAKNLEEEKAADKKLTTIALASVNLKAA